MSGPVLPVPAASVEHHVKSAIHDLAEAVEGLELTTESIQDTVGPLPASAEGPELRRAAHDCQAAADQIVSLALRIARAGGAFAMAAAVRSAAGDRVADLE